MLEFLLILNACLLSLVAALLWRNFKRLRVQEADIQPLLDIAPPPAAEVEEILGSPHPRLLSVEIQNPLQLAAKEMAAGGLFGHLAPETVRREVYRQAAKILREELEKWGIVSEVRVHAAR